MATQSLELAWDITDWELSAELSESNIMYNMQETFLKNGLLLPHAIVVRPDQANQLFSNFKNQMPVEAYGFNTITLPFGPVKMLIVRDAERKEVTRRVR
jgi:hypothetical protein